MKEIVTKSQESKNLAFTLKILLLHAKLAYQSQNVFKAIILYRNCKKTASSVKLYKIIGSCFKGLGFCFQFLKQYSLSLIYFTKFLQCSWHLKDQNKELLAYDLIGLQYYYLGEIEKSRYYHLKMVSGEVEPENSTLLKLGVARFLNKKPKNKDKNKKSTFEKHMSQFTDNYFSSSDEEFELPNPSK